MATFAVGDVHGNLAALDAVLAQLRVAATAADTIVFLGDYIDRGPDVKGCIDAILRLPHECEAHIVCLMGNHEDWLLRTMRDYTRHSWLLGMDAFDTISSYSPEAVEILKNALSAAGSDVFLGEYRLPYDAFFDVMPPEHVRFFETLQLFHETPDCVCTHAGLDPHGGPLHQQSRRALLWGCSRFPNDYAGRELVVYGHWRDAALDAQGRPLPRVSTNAIGIDTSTHGVLTAIRLPDRRLYYSAAS